MAFSEQTQNEAIGRSGKRCECVRRCSHHAGHRCNADLYDRGMHFYHVVSPWAGGPDTLMNCEVLCESCYRFATSYGIG